MKVSELMEMLSAYDDNIEVMIGNYQRYGSDFAYEINGIEDKMVFASYWSGEVDTNRKVIFLLEGSQEGTMAAPEDDDDIFDDEEYEY